MATIEDFAKIDIRLGKIIDIQDFPEARKPMYKMKINFGSEIGIRQSCGQFTQNYTKEELLGKHVLGIVNFPPRQIGPAISESLTLGLTDINGYAVLIQPDVNKPVTLGERLN